MRARYLIAATCGLLLTCLTSCTVRDEPGASARVSVFVSILPQAYFVERIGGERVSVQTLIGPGQSPATWEPSPARMAALSEADVFFRIGVPFENTLMPKIVSSLPDLNVVDTREGITLRPMGPGENAPRDPHIWLDPLLAKIQARTIADELSRLDPDGSDLYAQNLASLLDDLDSLDAEIREALGPARGSTMLVFHPSWGYFADRYGLRQLAIEVEGKSPGARQLHEIIETARAQGVRVIFVQPQFSTAGAEAIAREIGAVVTYADPLPRDYIAELRRVAHTVGDELDGGNHE
jgi:zinc transport system substrate-binding protein